MPSGATMHEAPNDDGIVTLEGTGLWQKMVNVRTGQHSYAEHEPKLIKQWCKDDDHYYEAKNPQSRTVLCNKCGKETYYVLGLQKLEAGKIITLNPEAFTTEGLQQAAKNTVVESQKANRDDYQNPEKPDEFIPVR